jgi:hypothetical protein
MKKNNYTRVILVDAFLGTNHHIAKIGAILKACNNLNMCVILLTNDQLQAYYIENFKKAHVITLPKIRKSRLLCIYSISLFLSYLPRDFWKNITYKKINFGRIAIDTVVRKRRGSYGTYNMERKRLRRALKYSFIRHYATNQLLNEYPKITDAIFFHKCYSLHGPIYQTLFINRVKMIYSIGDLFLKNKFFKDFPYSTISLNSSHMLKIDSKCSEKYFDARLNNSEIKDVVNAYLSKKRDDGWHIDMGIDVNKPIILYALHALSDWNNAYPMLYSDFQDAFWSFLNVARQFTDQFEILIKQHPSRHNYGEQDISKRYDLEGFYLLEDEIRTDDILKICDVVVTPRGTMSLEAVVENCQVINQSNSYFTNLGITDLALNKKKLESLLSMAKKKKIRSLEDKLSAKKALYFLHASYDSQLDLFPKEIVYVRSRANEKSSPKGIVTVNKEAVKGIEFFLNSDVEIMDRPKWKEIIN